MDNALLKERAKKNIAKKRGETIVVALIIAFVLSGVSLPNTGLNLSFDINSTDDMGSYYPADLLEGNFPFAFFTTAIIISLCVVALITVAKAVFLSPLAVGGYRYFLKIRKDENTGIGDTLGNFKDGNYLNVVLVMFLQNLFTYLWSMLCVIPGIIKGLEYSMIPFILAVRPNIDRKEAFRLSKALTDEHKLDLFWLQLSFIGWQILSALTCGILAIVYVNPYLDATLAEAFAYLREDAILKGTVRPEELPIYGGDSPDYTQQPFGGFNGFENNGNGFGGFNGSYGTNNGGFASDNSSTFASSENTAPTTDYTAPDTFNNGGYSEQSTPQNGLDSQPTAPTEAENIPTADVEILTDPSAKSSFDATGGSSNSDSSSEEPQSPENTDE